MSTDDAPACAHTCIMRWSNSIGGQPAERWLCRDCSSEFVRRDAIRAMLAAAEAERDEWKRAAEHSSDGLSQECAALARFAFEGELRARCEKLEAVAEAARNYVWSMQRNHCGVTATLEKALSALDSAPKPASAQPAAPEPIPQAHPACVAEALEELARLEETKRLWGTSKPWCDVLRERVAELRKGEK